MSLFDVVAEAGRREQTLVEDELAALVGTGLDLAVTRHTSMTGADYVVTLTFLPVKPGDTPPGFVGFIYRVSLLGAFARA